MLTIVPKSYKSFDSTIMQDSQPVADVDMSTMREKGVLTVEGTRYEVYREAMMSGDFVIKSDTGAILARAQKPSAFRHAFVVQYEGKQYKFRSKGFFSRAFLFFDDSTQVGSVAPKSFFSRESVADLPQELPLPVRVFVIWLALIMWKRSADASDNSN